MRTPSTTLSLRESEDTAEHLPEEPKLGLKLRPSAGFDVGGGGGGCEGRVMRVVRIAESGAREVLEGSSYCDPAVVAKLYATCCN